MSNLRSVLSFIINASILRLQSLIKVFFHFSKTLRLFLITSPCEQLTLLSNSSSSIAASIGFAITSTKVLILMNFPRVLTCSTRSSLRSSMRLMDCQKDLASASSVCCAIYAALRCTKTNFTLLQS